MKRLSLFVCGLLLASYLAAQTAPVMTLDFEGGFDAKTAAGPVQATLEGKPELAAGKFGQALKSGPGTGYLLLPTTLLKASAGTVEMWVSPLDWKPNDKEFHAFFDTRGEGALYLYKYVDGSDLLMLSCDNVAGPYHSSRFTLNWQPGEWHHIAGTWSAAGVLAYVDGKPATPFPVEARLPRKLGETFTLGDGPWHLPRTSSSLVDEVRIYDRALSAAHIAAHAEGKMDFVAPLDAKYSRLAFDLDPVKGDVVARVDTGGADVPDAGLTAKFALVGKGAALPAGAKEIPFEGGQALATLPVEQKPGQYELMAKVFTDGKEAFELRRELVVPDTTAWRGNKLGLEDKVLPPWTPVKVTGQRVAVWDREYDFGGENLVEQITSGGKALLAKPMTLVASKDNKTAAVACQPVGVPVATDTRAVMSKDLRGPATLTMKTTTEFDGFSVIELSGAAPNVQSLTLTIPVRPEIAMYRHRWMASWDSSKSTGLLPAGQGVIDQDKFIPYYWLGNNDRGLFWMCESDEMWPNGQAANALEVVREQDGSVALRLNLLAAGQKLPENWHFTFALQATPVKPLAKDWRKWRLQPGVNGNVSIMWPTPAQDSIKWFGYPEAKDPGLFQERVRKLHEAKAAAVPYLCLSFISAACPEWPFFSKYWAMGGVDSTSADVAAYGAGFAMASPVGPDYSDFIVWKTAEFIKQYGIRGLYHDNTHPYASTNKDAGCGYERDGQLHPTYPIRGFRDLYRRMYSVLKDEPGETFSMAHMSGKVTIPILGYEDAYLDGEHFRGVVRDSYLDLMSLDTFRTEYMGRQWGIMPFFLPEFDQEHQAQVEPTRGLMALLMLHDVSPWPLWCNLDVANEALAALDKFGYVDSRFIGYFDAPCPAATDMKDVYISAYVREDGKTLLIVGNVGKEDREGEVTIDPAALGVTMRQVSDWPTGERLELAGTKVKLTVPRLGYRMLLIQ